MIVLDTDVLSIVQRADSPTYDRLAECLDAADDDVVVSIITFEERKEEEKEEEPRLSARKMGARERRRGVMPHCHWRTVE